MASVLKPNDAMAMPPASSPSGLAGFNFEDLTQRAHQQLERCQQEIARMRAEATAEIDRLRHEAIEQGLNEGRAAAAAEADAKLRQAINERVGQHGQAVQSTVQQIANLHQQWLNSYADTLVAMVVAISERVIRGRLDREPEILLRWATESLGAARSANRLTVAVHPETLGELGQSLDELLRHPGLPEETSIIPDETVPRAGVVVRQVGGEVVATLETQLGRLKELLEHA